ncbi:MAG: GAK system ATP-grasp enzyme [Candidatus Delongbacteria bacterium]|nr:GAK system ATP-grasp enzyme [Candidatus Delongbacteria bacterium]
MKTIAVIGVHDGWSTGQLCRAFESLDCHCHLIEMDELSLDLGSGSLSWRGLDLGSLDAVVVKKIGNRYSPDLLSRLDLLEFLARVRGVPVFSPPAGMRLAVDRLSCTLTLRAANIPMPATTITEDPAEALKAIRAYGNAILKPLYTSKARGMQPVSAEEDLERILAAYKAAGNEMFYVQKRVMHRGRDLGIVFLDGALMGSYARVGGSSWNTTILHGGHYEHVTPSADLVELAQRAQAPFGLSFTCVDVVEAPEGPLIYEVSAFGGFRGLMKACELDAATLYAEWVLGRISGQTGTVSSRDANRPLEN